MSSLTVPNLTTNHPFSLYSSITPFNSPSKSTVSKSRNTIRAICDATSDDQYRNDDYTSSKNGTETSQMKFDRRNLLLGIGGFFSASTFGANPSAFAAPLAPTFTAPLLYCHHSNVDRMWNIWNTLGGQNIADSDWLNTSFLIYNEEAEPGRIYAKDCLDTTVIGYTNQTVDMPWMNFKPTPRRKGITLTSAPSPAEVFPATLQKTINVLVKRPKNSRTKKEKQEAEEVLEIFGIKYNSSEFVKFDVYINEDSPEESGPERTEFIGSFVNVPHGNSATMGSRTNRSFGLTEVLEELGADEFESILVTLVPKSGVVTISGIKIEFDI